MLQGTANALPSGTNWEDQALTLEGFLQETKGFLTG